MSEGMEGTDPEVQSGSENISNTIETDNSPEQFQDQQPSETEQIVKDGVLDDTATTEQNIRQSEPEKIINDEGMTRRDFVVGLAALTTLALGAKPAYDKIREIGEANLEDRINKLLNGNIADVRVPKNYGIDHFYARSGWNEGEGCVDSFTYREAVMQLNKMENTSLQENQALQVPIREGQSLEGGE